MVALHTTSSAPSLGYNFSARGDTVILPHLRCGSIVTKESLLCRPVRLDMVHPDTELRFVSPAVGWGVFATREIPTGTITWALDVLDQHFSDEDIRRLPDYARELVEEYAYIDGRGDHILCWDHARFYNHSCDANCLGVCDDFQMAVRDIAAGEELTDDYGTFNPREREPFHCSCGAAQCRGAVLPDDYLRIGGKWMKLARAAFFLIPTVPQPLWPVLRERQAVEAALADPSLLRITFCPRRRKAGSRMGR